MESTIQSSTARPAPGQSARSKSPVFVLGCPRSGTTLLYHMLLSAGNFAVYRTESNVFSILQPRFGDLALKRNRSELLEHWIRSRLFRETGLAAEAISEKIMMECHSAGDFLRITMEETARRQGVERWADTTPDHLLYIPQIKKEIPNALIVHIIRDGRDVALSYVKQGWAHPLPWDRDEELAVAGLYWEWIVSQGRRFGRNLGADYCELRYEDLLRNPQETLQDLGQFIAQELDYDHIRSVGIGSVTVPNSSFEQGAHFNPVGRWSEHMTPRQLQEFEALTGKYLQELGYPIGSAGKSSLKTMRLRFAYRAWFSSRHFLKNRTLLGRFSPIGRMGIQNSSLL